MSKMSDSIIDKPVDDSDYEYTRPSITEKEWDICKQDKLREEADDAMRSELEEEL